jgi:NADPH:quinone reductase-like Zn-dependent oxidoreductase
MARVARGSDSSGTKLMKAVVYERYGGPDALEIRELPVPVVHAGECLVRVAAVSVNPADWKLLAGHWRWVTGRRFPRRIGIDFSGIVEQTGAGVGSLAAGQPVMGSVAALKTGSLAEYVAVPASSLGRKPENVGLEEAAGIPVAGAAAHVGLGHRRPELRDKKILLTGAGGGVGHFVIQLAGVLGAEVTAVCSTGKVALCRDLGAHKVVDYTRSDPRSLGERFDLVFDCAVSLPYPAARRILRPGGEYLLLATQGNVGPFFRGLISQVTPGRRMWTFLVGPNGRRLDVLADLFERHKLRVVAPSRYSLEQSREAFRESIAGHATGKILITHGSV